MSFLEAHKTVSEFRGGPPLQFLLAASGTLDSLTIFLRAEAAKRSRDAQVRTLPFNTLGQWSFEPARDGETEVALLLPWDFAPEADWRSGVPESPPNLQGIRERAEGIAERLGRRPNLRALYLPAPLPPLFPDTSDDTDLALWLRSLARDLGAWPIPEEVFAIGSYLSSGTPVAGGAMSRVARAVVEAALSRAAPHKVLVSDLDYTMWSGVVGEDGVDGIRCGPEGVGYRHFLYQTFLAKLEREGVLIAAVSRNDEDTALEPFRKGRTAIDEDQFVAFLASYHAKSAQIGELASRLDLGLDSFVFVDDNPVELAEVSASHPTVRCIRFPEQDDELPAFLSRVGRLFSREAVTDEDRERTALYRRRLAGMAPASATGADLTEFLRELEMEMQIHDRSTGDRTRAVQLINKTNQFNLNGIRVTEDEVQQVLDAGGRLFTVTLSDRNGSHGEILSCLITADGVVTSFVMSCRVLQRRTESAFLAWLARTELAPRAFEFTETERNTPLRQFLDDPAFTATDGESLEFDADRFLEDHAADLELFDVQEPEAVAG